ncbi:MAG: hypothetical protein LBE83_04590 [Propionibacteriaceae bacterium]|jgi:hypothetical protein|nr:hypothetical protein [Propionibacteriaceae bacterium]
MRLQPESRSIFSCKSGAPHLVAAWHLLDADARAVFRSQLGVTEVEWHRGAAWAFEEAPGLVWYYLSSNPTMSALGRSTLARLLDEPTG